MSAEPKMKDFQEALEAISGGVVADRPGDFDRIIEEVRLGIRGKTRVKGPVRIGNGVLSGVLLETSEGGMMTGGAEIRTTPSTDVELRCKWIDVSEVEPDPHHAIVMGMHIIADGIIQIYGDSK